MALKFLPEALQSDAAALARLRREAKSAASLDHPFICKVYEVGETSDGRAFIAMEYVDGETLAARLEREPLSPKDGVRIALEIAEALSKAHEHRIVHRDLKPANVMLGRDGHVKVMDFGLATQVEVASTDSEAETVEGLSRRGSIAGTPGYMSPEQLRGESVDGRSDLFAFGVVLQEILTGTHPFRKASGAETMAAILKESPTGCEALPGVIQPLVDQLLSKKADDRPSHEHARAELQRVVERPELLEASATPERIFVGRESELAELRNLAEGLRTGKGSLALVGGEPGVGKTRLSEEILAFARNEGFLALEGHCYEMEGAQPYLPWIESLELAARLVPSGRLRDALGEAAPEVAKLVPELRRQYDDIGEPIDLPPEQQQRYLFNSVSGFLERLSQETPIVWLLDDLHWADESTLLLLQHLLQKLNDLPILLIGTYRDVELDVGKPFEKVLAQVVRQRLGHRITLRRLSEETTGEFLAALGGSAPPAALVGVIYKETEGNPFFVEEVFEHLSEERKLFDDEGEWIQEMSVSELEVPEGVRLVIGRRLERLSEDTPKVLGVAAVMGRMFDLRVLESVEELEAGCRARCHRGSGGSQARRFDDVGRIRVHTRAHSPHADGAIVSRATPTNAPSCGGRLRECARSESRGKGFGTGASSGTGGGRGRSVAHAPFSGARRRQSPGVGCCREISLLFRHRDFTRCRGQEAAGGLIIQTRARALKSEPIRARNRRLAAGSSALRGFGGSGRNHDRLRGGRLPAHPVESHR